MPTVAGVSDSSQGMCFCYGVTVFNRNGKSKSSLTVLEQYNPSGREAYSVKDYTSFQGLTTFTLEIKRMDGNPLILGKKIYIL